MSTTYAQKQSPAQKKETPTAASVLDVSSQSKSLQRKADMANNAAQRAEAPRPNNTGMPTNDNTALKHEADMISEKATSQSIATSNAVQLYPVVRGGYINPGNFTRGSGVTSALTGRTTSSCTEPLNGVSTICKTTNLSANVADDENEICRTIPHEQYGISSDTKVTEKKGTLGTARKWKGHTDIVHREINGLTANQLVEIFKPTKNKAHPAQ